MRSKASSLIERTNRSQCALRLGLRGAKTIGSTPLAFMKASNACVNFVSRSWSRYRLPRSNPSKGSVSCRAHGCIKAAGGVWGDAGDLHTACGQLHHHEHVVRDEAVPRRHLDGEKVRGSEHLPV